MWTGDQEMPAPNAAPQGAAGQPESLGVRRSSLQRVLYPEAAAANQSDRGVAQPGRAPGSGPGGRRFKSSLPDHCMTRPSAACGKTAREHIAMRAE